MIYTSSYENAKSTIYPVISISGDRGKSVGFTGPYYSKLAPKKVFWDVWKSNVGKIPEVENFKYYIREYWRYNLSTLNPKEVYDKLDNSILACYEANHLPCHRHIVAAWFEIFLGVTVHETVSLGKQITYISKPAFIKEYFEELLKEEFNVTDLTSLRSLYI